MDQKVGQAILFGGKRRLPASAWASSGRCSGPDYSRIPAASADSLARRGFSRSPSSTYRKGYACVVLACEKPPAGFGLDRLATAFLTNSGLWICGIEHVRETIPFPRMLYKIYP